MHKLSARNKSAYLSYHSSRTFTVMMTKAIIMYMMMFLIEFLCWYGGYFCHQLRLVCLQEFEQTYENIKR